MVLRQFLRPVIALVAVASLAGCSDGAGDSGTQLPSPTATTTVATTVTSPTASPTPPTGDLARRIDEAKQLAARDHDAEAADLVVVTAEEVEWPDSSYGCPLTEQTYEPGPFPGYQIVLDDDGRSYTYMGGEDTELKECLFLE